MKCEKSEFVLFPFFFLASNLNGVNTALIIMMMMVMLVMMISITGLVY